MISFNRFCVILRGNAAIVSLVLHLVGAWLYVILRSNAAIVSFVQSMAGHICACVIRACLTHASVHERLMSHVWLVLMLVVSHFSFLMLILILVLEFSLYNFVYSFKFCFCCTVRSCVGRTCLLHSSRIQGNWLSNQFLIFFFSCHIFSRWRNILCFFSLSIFFFMEELFFFGWIRIA